MSLHGAYFGVAEGSLFVLDRGGEGISQRAASYWPHPEEA